MGAKIAHSTSLSWLARKNFLPTRNFYKRPVFIVSRVLVIFSKKAGKSVIKPWILIVGEIDKRTQFWVGRDAKTRARYPVDRFARGVLLAAISTGELRKQKNEVGWNF